MRRKRIYSLLLALALAAGLLTGCGQENAAQESTADEALPTLVVGVDTYPPYSHIGPDGTPRASTSSWRRRRCGGWDTGRSSGSSTGRRRAHC